MLCDACLCEVQAGCEVSERGGLLRGEQWVMMQCQVSQDSGDGDIPHQDSGVRDRGGGLTGSGRGHQGWVGGANLR